MNGIKTDYQTLIGKADDFDKYWEHAKASIDIDKIKYTITPVDSVYNNEVIQLNELIFTAIDGSEIYVKYAKNKKATNKPALICFHGYTAMSADWFELAGFCNLGFDVFAMDVRGQMGKSINNHKVAGTDINGHIIRGLQGGKDTLLLKQIFLDCYTIAKLVIDKIDGIDKEKVYTRGASQGGALALVAAALEPRISKVCTVYPFFSDYKRIMSLNPENSAYHEIHEFLRRYDAQHKQEDYYFGALSYVDVSNLAPYIKGKVRFVASCKDVVCPFPTQMSAYNAIQSEKELIIYHDYGHEELPKNIDDEVDFLLN